ncbi:MAG: hypothetical protein EOP22_08030 [Hyphomicrobiales bacterium]|nr:MAG: hypothetical protein EOP22_08030 [Hyphomicrobiales bacterium]
MSEWIELTSRTDRGKVWINMSAALSVHKDAGGSKIVFPARELFVTESPENVMSRRLDARRET